MKYIIYQKVQQNQFYQMKLNYLQTHLKICVDH